MCRLMGTGGLRKKMKWLLFGVVGGPVGHETHSAAVGCSRVVSTGSVTVPVHAEQQSADVGTSHVGCGSWHCHDGARDEGLGDVGHGKAVRCSLALTRPCSRDESDPGAIPRPAAHYYTSMCDVCGRLPSFPSLWSYTGGKRIAHSQREASTRTDAIAEPRHLAVTVNALADVAVARGRLPRSTIVFCVSWNRIAAWGGTRRR